MGVRIVNDDGETIEVSADKVGNQLAQGGRLESAQEAEDRLTEAAQENVYGGLGGTIATGTLNALSGLTLGGSDIVFSGLLDDYGRQKEISDRVNPYAAAGGQLVGSVAGGLAAPGSFLGRTPAGILGRWATEGAEAARGLGGLGGAARAIGYYGAEGAIQNAGQYLAHAATENKELTAEGLAGALGTGFAFSAAGAGAALGIEKGTIAARKLFSKVAGSEDALVAAANWERKSSEIINANDETLKAAKSELENIQALKQEAAIQRAKAASNLQEEKLIAQRAASEAPTEAVTALDAPTAKLAQEINQTPTATLVDNLMPKPPVVEIDAGMLKREAELTDAIQEAEAAQSSMLERQLTAMKSKIDEGSTLKQLNEARAAGTTSAKAADAVEEIAKHANAVTDYEKTFANLTDLVGDAAHPVSKEAAAGFRAAEESATKETISRTVRAAEDVEKFGPAKATSEERIAYAKERLGEANVNLSNIRTKELEAQQAVKNARAAQKAQQASLDAVSLPGMKGGAPAKKGIGGTLEKVGVGLEVADTLHQMGVPGIPGLPSAKDIPVVGPLLSGWLKLKAFTGLGGRITATGDAKAAALAAQTKTKVIQAVDRMLGLAERVAASPKTAKVMANVGNALGRRIYDDGNPDAHEKADLREKAAVRAREIAAYVSSPNAIENDVRRELRDVTNPSLIAAVEAQRRAAFQYLLDKMPKQPAPDPLGKAKWTPSAADAISLARRLEVINDPTVALHGIMDGTLTLEGAETLRKVYPQIFAVAQGRLMDQAGNVSDSVPYAKRVRMSLLFDIPLHSSLRPENMAILQAPYQKAADQAAPAPMPGQPPMPSVAGGTNLNSMYQTPDQRSALRR